MAFNNCAFNVTVTAQLAFGRQPDLLSLQRRYGESLQNLGSLGDIASELENSGLFVEGVEIHSSRLVVDLLDDGYFVVVALKRNPLGHFVAIWKDANMNAFAIFDFPHEKRQATAEEVQSLLINNSTGKFLLVHMAKIELDALKMASGELDIDTSSQSTPRPKFESLVTPKEITARENTDGLIATFLVRNSGQSVARIERIKGSCSCLRSVTPSSFTLQPRAEQEVCAQFDARKFDRDSGALLVLECDESIGSRVVKVGFDKNGMEPKPEQIICSAGLVHFGLQNRDVTCNAKVTVLVPESIAEIGHRQELVVSFGHPLACEQIYDGEIRIGRNLYKKWILMMSCDPDHNNGYFKQRVEIKYGTVNCSFDVEAYFKDPAE